MALTYVDSCVLIDAFVNPEERGRQARSALEDAGAGVLLISPLVELECMVRPLRSGDQAWITAMRSALRRFRRVTITARCYELAAHMRAIHGLQTADALHAATASLADCDTFWTSDRRMQAALPGFAVDPTPGS